MARNMSTKGEAPLVWWKVTESSLSKLLGRLIKGATKSEARAALKQAMKEEKLPAGTRLERQA